MNYWCGVQLQTALNDHLAKFSFDRVLAHYFVVPHHSLLSTPTYIL